MKQFFAYLLVMKKEFENGNKNHMIWKVDILNPTQITLKH